MHRSAGKEEGEPSLAEVEKGMVVAASVLGKEGYPVARNQCSPFQEHKQKIRLQDRHHRNHCLNYTRTFPSTD